MVALWVVVTIGIYTWFWYFRINRELRDYGQSIGDEGLANSNPVLSVLAVTIGWLVIVPPLVSYWRCTRRIQSAERLAGNDPVSGWLILALFFFGAIAIPSVVQDRLNAIWNQLPA